jgi:hypothetical protein
VQQEQPRETVRLILDFLSTLGRSSNPSSI